MPGIKIPKGHNPFDVIKTKQCEAAESGNFESPHQAFLAMVGKINGWKNVTPAMVQPHQQALLEACQQYQRTFNKIGLAFLPVIGAAAPSSLWIFIQLDMSHLDPRRIVSWVVGWLLLGFGSYSNLAINVIRKLQEAASMLAEFAKGQKQKSLASPRLNNIFCLTPPARPCNNSPTRINQVAMFGGIAPPALGGCL